ncbi:MAG TPA: Flp family type IVb pilin [Acidimicrobiia bacterium]|nr:Flp family type IVb pilin [Acidimicrobiia bacterium]
MLFHTFTWLKAHLVSRMENERGATAVEYGLMVALIAVAIITTVGLLGTALDSKFDEVKTAVEGA